MNNRNDPKKPDSTFYHQLQHRFINHYIDYLSKELINISVYRT